jgi:hypothetical protein
LRQAHDHLREEGLQLVVIGMGSPEHSRNFRQQLHLPFPLLSDPECMAYRAYGLSRLTIRKEVRPANLLRLIRNTLKHGGSISRNQDTEQLGGAFVINRHGIIIYAHRAAYSAETVSTETLRQVASSLT